MNNKKKNEKLKQYKMVSGINKKYAIKQMIGQGQFGKVYRGECLGSGGQQYGVGMGNVAIKVIHNSKFRKNQKLKTLLANQMEVLSQLIHHNIIKFIEFALGEKQIYMIYEYCEGGTLQDRSVMQQKQLLPLLVQIIDAFVAAERLNILHRDIKPANILLKDGRIKVADWGFSRVLYEGQTTQSFIGSPAYMAPEVLKSEQYTVKADVWSLGVMLYQTLCGCCPWTGQTVHALIKDICTKHITFPPNVTISKQMKRILTLMLNNSKQERASFLYVQSLVIKMVVAQQKNNLLTLTDIKRNQNQQKHKEKVHTLLCCTFFLEMVQISKKLAFSQQNLILFLKLIEQNLKKVSRKYGMQCDSQLYKMLKREAKMVNEMRYNIQKSLNARKKSVDMNKSKKGQQDLKSINNPETSHKKKRQTQQSNSGLNPKLIKQVINVVLNKLQKILSQIKVNKKELNCVMQPNKSIAYELIQLNCMLDLIVYKQIPQQYNKKSVKSYVQALKQYKESMLIKLLNYKLIVVNQTYFQ